MHQRGEKISRYLIRVCHMRQLKAQIVAMHGRVAESRRETARCNAWLEKYRAEVGKQEVKERRLVRVAVLAVLMCPGSFVAGGFFLKHVLEWWW